VFSKLRVYWRLYTAVEAEQIVDSLRRVRTEVEGGYHGWSRRARGRVYATVADVGTGPGIAAGHSTRKAEIRPLCRCRGLVQLKSKSKSSISERTRTWKRKTYMQAPIQGDIARLASSWIEDLHRNELM
jgi:hypothetical protein